MALAQQIDPQAFLDFAMASTQVRTAAQYEQLVRERVKNILPHGMGLACVFRIRFDHVEIHRLLGVDFPQEHIRRMPKIFNVDERRVAQRWMETQEPVYVGPDAGEDLISPRLRAEREALALGHFAAHGVFDLSHNMGTYYTFYRLPPQLPPEDVAQRLRLICPLLHQAFIRLQDSPMIEKDPLADLTPVERELLSWVATGRTNAEIAALRGRSHSTVRNQLEVLYRKLGVGNRAEASRIAASAGLTNRSPASSVSPPAGRRAGD